MVFWQNKRRLRAAVAKHCQRHNGPEGWVHIISSNTNLDHFILRISTKHQLQNLNQTTASPQNLNFKILTKPSFRISTKIQLHNLYKTSAAKNCPNSSFKSCPNFNVKILTKPCAQSLNKSLAFYQTSVWNLQQIVANTILISNSNLNKFWVSHARVHQSSLPHRS